MNRINKIFQEKSKGLLSLYFCAGHPTLESTTAQLFRTQPPSRCETE